MKSIDSKLLLGLVVGAAVGAAVGYLVATDKKEQILDELNNVVEENINGIRVVKSLVREEKEKNKFEIISNEIYNEFSKGEKIIVLNSPVLQSAIYICIILISWFGAKIVV